MTTMNRAERCGFIVPGMDAHCLVRPGVAEMIRQLQWRAVRWRLITSREGQPRRWSAMYAHATLDDPL